MRPTGAARPVNLTQRAIEIPSRCRAKTGRGRNIQFIEDCFRGERQVPAAVRDVITAHVNASPGLSLDQLLCSTAHSASADDVFSLIATGGLYVDFWKRPSPNHSKSPCSWTTGYPAYRALKRHSGSERQPWPAKTTSASPTFDCGMCPPLCAERQKTTPRLGPCADG